MDWVRAHWRYVIGFSIALILPFGIQWLMTHGFWENTAGGTNDGWLGFWGGYLGAIISVSGVYYQVSKELSANKKQFETSKYPKIRIVVGTIALNKIAPKVVQQYPDETDDSRIARYREFTEIWRADDRRIAGISFANISSNRFYDALVVVEYSSYERIESDGEFRGNMIKRSPDRFAIPEMGEQEKEVTILYAPVLFNAYFDNSVKKVETIKEVKSITVYGQTETGQIIKISFDHIRTYNYIPREVMIGKTIENEYVTLANEDIFPLMRLTKDYGEKWSAIRKLRDTLIIWISIKDRYTEK